MNRFIVMTASAQMPASCWGRYGRIAVVELTPEYAEKNLRPRMISDRARGVAKLVSTWERLHISRVGSDRDAFSQGMREATAMCDQLNGERHDAAA